MSQPSQSSISMFFVAPILALFVWTVHSVLLPVALGALFAVILYPSVPWLRALLGRFQRAAAGIVLTVGTVVLLVPMAFVCIMGARTILQLTKGGNLESMRSSVESVVSTQIQRLGSYGDGLGIHINGDAVRDHIIAGAEHVLRLAGERLGGAAASTADWVVSIFLFLCALYAFLEDGERAVRWLGAAMPFSHQQTKDLFESVRQAVRGVVLGSMLTGLLQSLLCLVALLLFRVPGAFVWSVAAFVMSFLPVVGTTPVTMGSALYLGLANHWGLAAGMGAAALVIGSADNLVRPLVQGAESHMHPLLTLAAIFGGLEVMGGAGIFLGPVIAAMALWSIDSYVAARAVHSLAL